MLRKIQPFLVIYVVFALALIGCESHDPDLEIPESGGSGYNLTPLGALVYRPWQVDRAVNGTNVEIFLGASLCSSLGQPYSKTEKNLLFLLMKKGGVRYSFERSRSDKG